MRRKIDISFQTTQDIAQKAAFVIAVRENKKIEELGEILPDLMSADAAQALLQELDKTSSEEIWKEASSYIYSMGLRAAKRKMPEKTPIFRDITQEEANLYLKTRLVHDRFMFYMSEYFMSSPEHAEEKNAFSEFYSLLSDEISQEQKKIIEQWFLAALQYEDFDYLNPARKYSKIFAYDNINLCASEETIRENKAYKWLSEGIGHEMPIDADTVSFFKIASVVQSLSEDGQAAFSLRHYHNLMNFSELWKFFILQGCIRTVIHEPPTADSVLILLRAPHPELAQKGVSVYDASLKTFYWLNEFRQEIAEALQQKENIYSLEEIEKNNWCLNLSREKTFSLGDVITDMTRGVPSSALKRENGELKISDHKTQYRYLHTADLYDGTLHPVTYLESIPRKQTQYCLETENALLIAKTRTDAGYKTAVFQSEKNKKGEKILLNDNIYMINIDEKKADLYYIQAYLESQEGQKMLYEMTYFTNFIINLGVDDLKKIRIPACDLNIQKKIGTAFYQKLQEIAECRKKLEELLNQKNTLFYEEKNSCLN